MLPRRSTRLAPPRDSRQPSRFTYVLVTPARNEQAFIEETIQCMIRQTRTPLRWVIVDDGSTDHTADIVRPYALTYEWIELVRLPVKIERHFAAKVHAFNAGHARLAALTYDVIGNLDADVSFGPDYFAFLLERFEQMPGLGVAGTPFSEGGFQYDYRFVSIDHVSGACQLFSRECFADIGGYTPIKDGGVDLVAVTTARMKGWTTRTFPERPYRHRRKIGTAKTGVLKAKFRVGQQDYRLGSHPLWELFRALYQMTLRPYALGGLLILVGYLWAAVRRRERPISPELVTFRRSEQMRRLNVALRRHGVMPLQTTAAERRTAEPLDADSPGARRR